MRKVFKPENIIKQNKTVIIPDIEFKPEPIPEESESDESTVLTEEIYQNIREEVREELAGELGKQKLYAAHERDVMLHNAKREAKKLVDGANQKKSQILEEANTTSEEIRKNAYDEGLKKGIKEKSELLENLAHYISHSIEQIKHDEKVYFKEYAKQLKYVGAEIAEKIIYQKIQDDDMVMYNLVKNAVKSVRDASWIKVEVSEKLSGYADSLEKELSENGMNAEIFISENVSDDTCILNTSNGFIVATISKQIENLREFIIRQDKSDNDEELS